MTNIIGQINNSAGVGLTGQLIVTIVTPDNSDTTNSIVTQAPAVIECAAGVIDIDLIPFFETSYHFVYKVGEIIYLDFHAIVFPSDTPITITSLFPTGNTSDYLDTSLIRLAGLANFSGGSGGGGSADISNLPYGIAWIGNFAGASKNVLYEKFEAVVAAIAALSGSISGFAPTLNPTFTGVVTVPTATLNDSSTRAASTSYVQTELANYSNSSSVNTSLALKANLASPTFTGSVNLPTPTPANNSTLGATTAYVQIELGNYTSTTSLNTSLALKANLASPTFTGSVNLPTPAAANNSTLGATTAYVQTELGNYSLTSSITTSLALKANLASPTFTGSVNLPTPAAANNSTLGATTAYVQTELGNYTTTASLTTSLALKANSASPTLTGTVTIPTPTAGDNSTKAASTAYVQTAIAGLSGGGGSYSQTPSGILYPTPSWSASATRASVLALNPSYLTEGTITDLSTNARTLAHYSGVSTAATDLDGNFTNSTNISRHIYKSSFLGGRVYFKHIGYGGNNGVGVIGNNIFGTGGSTVYLVHRYAFTNNADLTGWLHGSDGAGSGYSQMAYGYGQFPRLAWGKTDHGGGNRIPAIITHEWHLFSYHLNVESSNLRTIYRVDDVERSIDVRAGTATTGTAWWFQPTIGGGSYDCAFNLIFPNYIDPAGANHQTILKYIKILFPMLAFPFPA